jgi:hypothetical protein
MDADKGRLLNSKVLLLKTAIYSALQYNYHPNNNACRNKFLDLYCNNFLHIIDWSFLGLFY